MNEQAKELFERQFAVELPNRDRAMSDQIGQTRQPFISGGMADSSRLALAVGRVVGEELQMRGQMALQILNRTHTSLGLPLDEQYTAEAKALLADVISAQVESLRKSLIKGRYVEVSQGEFEKYVQQTLEKISVQLDMQAAQVSKLVSQGSVGPSSVVIHGTVANIQVGGIGNVANASIMIDNSFKTSISSALTQVSEMVDALPNGSLDKADVQAAIRDALEESKKETPSKTKLKGLLSGIGDALNGVVAAKEAYEVLKGVASSFGIELP